MTNYEWTIIIITGITGIATVVMAVVYCLLLGQLKLMKEQVSQNENQTQKNDEWHRRNNVITNFPYGDVMKYCDNLYAMEKQYMHEIAVPLTYADVAPVSRIPQVFNALADCLNYFQGMCSYGCWCTR